MRFSAPLATEFAASFARYVARVADVHEPLDELTAQRARVIARLSPLSDEQASFRYAPDKWTIKDVIGHLSDVERVFTYRLLRVGRGDETPLPGFEENDYARTAGAGDRRVSDLLGEWSSVRDATTSLARSLSEPSWSNRGTANGASITARALLYIVLGHTEHHLAVLSDRYDV